MSAWPYPPPNLAGIPETLRGRRRWMISVPVLQENGKWSKPPHAPQTGFKADKTNPGNWSTFDEAVQAMPRFGAPLIGFALSHDEGLTFIDLDRCFVDDHLTPWALDVVLQVSSYTEYSPSGTGLRIVAEGSLPTGGRVVSEKRLGDGGRIELFDGGAFFTMTGRWLHGTPVVVCERAAALAELHAGLFPPLPAPKPRQHAAPVADDQDLLRRAMRDATFSRLWSGDVGVTGGDHSQADWQLVLRLLFWTRNDTGRADGLFRQSGLMREKWDRPAGPGVTYGERTLTKAAMR